MRALSGKVLHPFLFAAYPVLALLANNVEEVRSAAALRPLLISIAAATILFLLLNAWLHDRYRAGFITTLVTALFFTYGHVYNSLETMSLGGFSPGRHRLLGPLWLVLLVLGLWWALRPGRDYRKATPALNGFAAVALLFPLLQIGQFEVRNVSAFERRPAPAQENARLHLPAGQVAPDIYYIILDGYTRDDILKKFYNLDNSPFLDQLASLGFYVARCSQSNYSQTQLSLASSLNMDYLDKLGYASGSKDTTRAGLPDLIHHSRVRRDLESLGYQVVAFETGFDATQIEDADVYLSPRKFSAISDFENLLIRTTAGRILSEGVAFLNLKPDWEARDQAQRERILFDLDSLRRMPDEPGPKLVFAHIVAPHWPHVFGPNGEKVHQHPNSAKGYSDQVRFLNSQLPAILQEILARSPVPPVIIIQGDHGSVIESAHRRMPILNAYYLPGAGTQVLYPGISPVNSFRVVFDTTFQADLGLLEDKSLYSRYEDPFNFQTIDNQRPDCP